MSTAQCYTRLHTELTLFNTPHMVTVSIIQIMSLLSSKKYKYWKLMLGARNTWLWLLMKTSSVEMSSHISGGLSYHWYLLLFALHWEIFCDKFCLNIFIKILATLESRARKNVVQIDRTLALERTSQDQNFAQAAKTLFRIIQCIHHFTIANSQLNGTVTESFEAILSDPNKFVKPVCPTASLAQQIDLINSRWLQDITERLVAHFLERIDNFKRQLSTID